MLPDTYIECKFSVFEIIFFDSGKKIRSNSYP